MLAMLRSTVRAAPAFFLTIALLTRHIDDSVALAPTSGRKISVVSALLPTSSAGGVPRGRGAQLRIEAFGGCYKWESAYPELVSIEAPEPLEPHAETLECMERKAFECMDRGPTLRQELFGASEDASSSQDGSSCQPVAIVRSVARDIEGTLKVFVFARDVNDPDVELRCEVYITKIARVAVETSARSINVDDVLELTAKAYDEQGNVFSSLEGLEFDWHIKDQNILRNPPLAETAFQFSPARRALAQEGAKSDLLLVRGVSTGRTAISVNLRGRGSNELHSREIELKVKENILLVPSSVQVPPMGQLQLRLKSGSKQSQEVPLPVPDFLWSSETIKAEGPADVLFPPSQSGRVVAQDLGQARVIVTDRRINDSSTFSDIKVKEPHGLAVTPFILDQDGKLEWHSIQRLSTYPDLQMKPWPWNETGWDFVKGRMYLLKLELLDEKKKILFVPPNLRVGFDCKGGDANAPCPLEVLQKTINSQVIIFKAGRIGSGALSFSDISMTDEVHGSQGRKWPNIATKVNFHVAEPLQIKTPFSGPLVLPPDHVFALDVTGGSGVFSFRVRTNICKVSSAGVVESLSELGNTEIEVFDARNPANSISLKVLVRQPGALLLRPPYLQFQLSGEDGGNVLIPLFAQPEAHAEDEDPDWRRLRFWNCSALQAVFSAESSSDIVQVVSTTSATSSEEAHRGACYVISILPKSVGNTTLSASLLTTRAQGKDVRLQASANLQVYAPLTLSYHDDDKIASGQQSEEHLSPCSTAMLFFKDGPFSMSVPGRVFRNLSSDVEGTHLRLRPAGDRGFEVLCLKTTQGKVKIFAEVRLEPSDVDAHGDAVVARSSAWVSCTAPVSTNVVPVILDGVSSTASSSKNSFLGIRQGHRHQFGASYVDRDGRQLVTASAFKRVWTLDYSDGASAKELLTTDAAQHAVISVPKDAILGQSVKLTVTVSLPDSASCSALYSLEGRYAEALRDGLANLLPPASDTLNLRVTADFMVRWPGYPSRHFAFAPEWAFTFEAGHGSGVASLSFNDSLVSQVGAGSVCHAASRTNLDSCLKVVPASPGVKEATTWFLQPSSAGYVQVVIEDSNQLGVAPQVIDVSFLPVSRISLALSEVQIEAQSTRLLIVRGRRHPLAVDLWDTSGQLLSTPNWEAVQLVVAANDTRLNVTMVDGAFDVSGSALGSFEILATSRNYPNSVVSSNTLHVHVFEMFSIAPTYAVILPGQTFEFTLRGGPAAGAADSARVEFTSSNAGVAEVRDDGLITGRSVGSTQIAARLVEAETGRELAVISAQVIVATPDHAAIELMEFDGRDSKADPLLVRGSLNPLRLVASLSSRGNVLTQYLLTAPMVPLQDQPSIGCRFTWSSTDASVSLVPVGNPNLIGAGVVDTFAADVSDSSTVASVKLIVLVDCPNVRRLDAHLDIPVTQPLRLVTPATEAGNFASVALLRMPPFARTPLLFSQPPENLQISLSDTGSGSEPVARIDHHGHSVELVAGPLEGEVLAVVRDQRLGSSTPPLMVTIVVRAAHGLDLSPALPRWLMLHSAAEMIVQLRDQTGAALVLSSEASVKHSVSHPSVLASQVTDTPTGGKLLRLRAIREGCAAVNISTELPVRMGTSTNVLADVVLVCVSPGALVGHHQPLVVQPGATMHFAVDVAAVKGDEDALSFSVRIQLPPDDSLSADAISGLLAVDVSRLLELPLDAVSVLEIRWILRHDRLCSGVGFDANIRIKSASLSPGIGLPELAQKIWFHPGLAASGPILKHLDLAYGIHAPLWRESSSRSSRFSNLHSACSGHEGLSTSDSRVLTVVENEAIAMQSGEASVHICSGAVAAEADVSVADILEIRTEVQTSGPFLASRAVSMTDSSTVGARVANRAGTGPLVVLLRFFARDSIEILSGPFHSQNVEFTCQAVDSFFEDFFTFESWQAFGNSSAGVLRHTGDANSSFQLPWGQGAAQAACILHPKEPNDVQKLSRSLAPHTLSLQVSVHCTSCSFPPMVVVDWSFVPEFVVVDSEGRHLGDGELCGNVTLQEQSATFSVWTGGFPVEAALSRQLKSDSRGVITVHMSDQQAATITVTVVWDAAVEFGSAEEIDLQLESRTSGQTQNLKVRIDGSPAEEPVKKAVLSTGGFFTFRRTLLLLCLACACLAWCFYSQRSEVGSGSNFPTNFAAPRQPTAPARRPIPGCETSSGAIPQHGFGMSPFRPVLQQY